MPRPLVVHAAELLRRPGSERDVILAVAPEELDIVDERLVPDTPIEVSLHLESLSDGIVVRGSVSVVWQGVCRRCLRAVSERDVANVHELYQVLVTDPDAFAVVGDLLDLVPMVREHALLSLPLSPLCRPDCAGLCPHCGLDLNEGSCDGAVAPRDDRWAALDALRERLAVGDDTDEWSTGA
jgi:uncharacterized protein